MLSSKRVDFPFLGQMGSTYQKTWLSISDQIKHLKDRGLIFADEEQARRTLETVGYYRLSGYLYPLRRLAPQGGFRQGLFETGASFEVAAALCAFDKPCVFICWSPSKPSRRWFGQSLRTTLGSSTGSRMKSRFFEPWFLKPKASGKSQHEECLERLGALVDKSKEDFVKHFRQKYGLPLPIWASVELWEFGMLSRFFGGLRSNHKVAISAQFSVGDGKMFASWLQSLNYARNLVAHHSRVWNRTLVNQPQLPKSTISGLEVLGRLAPNGQGRIFAVMSILLFLLERLGRQEEADSWRSRTQNLIGQFPKSSLVDSLSMGIPRDWMIFRPWA